MSSLFYDIGPSASGRKVLLATTVYENCDASYTFSIARSREALTAAGIQSAYLLLSGNCHVDDARNTVVHHFLRSDCTELLFLDADVSWEPEHLVALCQYDKDIVGGVYPYRREDKAAESMPVRMLPDCFTPDKDGLLEVDGLPTGFLRIKRHVIETLAEGAQTFVKDGEEYKILFERDLYQGGRRSGDIHFCMNWRERGGKLYAATNLRLGHAGKAVLRDTLAASLRRQSGGTLAHVAKAIRSGENVTDVLHEARKALDNGWGAPVDVLELLVGLARSSKGPILEMGSGLSTIVMAAANPEQTVWCVEHSPEYAVKLENMAHRAGVSNIAVVTCGIKDGWYDLQADRPAMPARFGLAFVDGPPRGASDRTTFYEAFGDVCDVILADDADEAGYGNRLRAWAEEKARDIRIDGRPAVILPKN